MTGLDVIPIPGTVGLWARRCVVNAWQAAGSPAILWAGRTYAQQKALYDAYRVGHGNAADNPDAPTRLPHVRGMALDLVATDPATVRRMEQAGFVRPVWRRTGFSQDEPWHWELAAHVADIRSIPLVTAAPAGGDPKSFTPPEEDSMGFYWTIGPQAAKYWFSFTTGRSRQISKAEWAMLRGVQSGANPRVELPQVVQVSESFAKASLLPTVT